MVPLISPAAAYIEIKEAGYQRGSRSSLMAAADRFVLIHLTVQVSYQAGRTKNLKMIEMY